MNRRTKPEQPRKPPSGRITVGVVGVGTMWERRYRQALERLSSRITVVSIFDAVRAKAQQAAADFKADVAVGLRQLFQRPDVQAVLVFDPGWLELFPAELACEYRKPAFLAGSLGTDLAALQHLHRWAVSQQTLLMSEFSRRYTPASNRLRELIATGLGQARTVSVQATVPLFPVRGSLPGQACERDFLAGLLDWCQYITGRVPVSLAARAAPPSLAGQGGEVSEWEVELGFRPDASGRPATMAHLRLFPSADKPCSDEQDWPFPAHSVICEHGEARFDQPHAISWQNGVKRSVGTEYLTTERTDAEVMLDQFARRVLGGVIPVADVQDVCRALSLAVTAEQCRVTGKSALTPWVSET